MEKGKKPKKIKTSIYLPEEIFWRAKELAVSKRMGDNEVLEEAVRKWVERETAAAKSPSGKAGGA